MEVTIRRLKKPKTMDLEGSLEWFCECLGLSKGRDIEKTSIKLLTCFLRHSRKENDISPEIIAKDMGMARSTIVHHLQRYEKAGLVVKTRKGYELRERTLEEVVREIERDVEKELERIREVARKIDEMLMYR